MGIVDSGIFGAPVGTNNEDIIAFADLILNIL